jgi:hypothetical protein
MLLDKLSYDEEEQDNANKSWLVQGKYMADHIAKRVAV